MGDLIGSTQALRVHASSLKVVGSNISNVNNSSYARQTVATESYAGPGGAVYTSTQTQSTRDAIVDKQVVSEISRTGTAEAQYALYNDLNSVMSEELNGSIGASLDTAEAQGTGITGALSTFFNSWSALSASPSSAGAKAEVYSAAEELASRLNAASDAIDEAEALKTDSLNSQIDDVNGLLQKIATLNSDIIRMEAREAGSSITLQDERQAAIEELASYMKVSTQAQENGSVTVSLPSRGGVAGQVLVANGNAATISATDSALQATYGGVTSTITLEEGSLSVLDPASIGAVFDGLRSQLDALAGQLMSSVNAAYQQSGEGDFFTGTDAGDIALAVADSSDIVAASSTEASGGNSVATAIAALASQEYTEGTDSIGGTFSEYAAGMATDVAAKLESATDALETQQTVEDLIRSNRDNISGVSTDEEMTDLLRAQNAYQASARILNVINTLLDLVTTRLGA
jgi:flagellar hook-associated protein 1 FlgK